MNHARVTVADIHKSFGSKEVLKGVSLSLDPGCVFGLIGLNGAGKTTLIRILLGLIRPDLGTCSVFGLDPAKQQREYYRHIGVILEHNGFSGNLTVMQNLHFFARGKGISNEWLTRYIQEHWKNTVLIQDTRKVKYFSRGQKVQCGICRAFLGFPKVYFFDEPQVSLDIEAYEHFCTLVRKAQHEDATLIISSHQLDAIEELCSMVGILEKGRLNIIKNRHTGRTVSDEWVIKTPLEERCKSIIEAVTGNKAFFQEGYWHALIAKDNESMIAETIRQLVSNGIPVFEARPEKQYIRSSMKRVVSSES